MNQPLSHIIFKNTLFNFLTQIILAFVSLWSIPYIIKGVSNDGFGLLSILWAFIGYFALLDFGISRAIVKFLSEAIAAEDKDKIKKIVWTSIVVILFIGIVSGCIVVFSAPIVVKNIVANNALMMKDATTSLLMIGISVPFLLLFGALKGFQMAFQRFDIFNSFQGLTGVVQSVGSVILILSGYGLLEIIFLTIISRIMLSLIALAILPLMIPGIFSTPSAVDKFVMKKLFSFGGWITISQLISPLFLYLDRILIGIYLPLSAVAYYTVPQEALTRVLVIPMSLTTTLFPAMSKQSVLPTDEDKSGVFYFRSLKYLSIIMTPIVICLFLFAHEILNVWIGNEFALQSKIIFQILAVGLFFNAVAQIPATYLHATGRPDITAKFHIVELPVMIIFNVILIPIIGIVGTAITWTLRVVFDFMMLYFTVQKQVKKNSFVANNSRKQLIMKYLPVIGVLLVSPLVMLVGTTGKIVLIPVIIGIYAVAIWFFSLDTVDRNFILRYKEKIFN
jgi:O-antigen/teichoic acid export membrane protein